MTIPNTPAVLKAFEAQLPSPESKRSYLSAVERFVATKKPWTTASVITYLRDLHAKGLRRATIGIHLTALKRFMQVAIESKKVKPTVDTITFMKLGIGAIQPLSAQREAPSVQVLSNAQTMELLAKPDRTVLRGKRDYALLSLLLDTGLTPSECGKLTPAHLNLKNASITVPGQAKRELRISRASVSALGAWLKALPSVPNTQSLWARTTRATDSNFMSKKTINIAHMLSVNYHVSCSQIRATLMAKKMASHTPQAEMLRFFGLTDPRRLGMNGQPNRLSVTVTAARTIQKRPTPALPMGRATARAGA